MSQFCSSLYCFPTQLPDFCQYEVSSCRCQETTHVLLVNGLCPTTPSYLCITVSIHLLKFYHALFEKSCDVVNVIANTLSIFYTQQGFVLLDKKVSLIDTQKLVFTNIHLMAGETYSRCLLKGARLCNLVAAQILQQRCSTYFSGIVYGQPLEQGCNIHIAIDGNFNHQHLQSAGQCPMFYSSEYMLSKELVNAVGNHIKSLHKHPPKPQQAIVPDEAVDECESSHTTDSRLNSKTNMEKFDDSGLMMLVYCHDITLFLTNIDTLGEQQKYAVALIEVLFSLLLSNATVVGLYDVGCVLDCSLQWYDILPTTIMEYLLLTTSAMHAYAHQWACQLVYNPWLQIGLGLSDSKGVEQLWSQLRKHIGIIRSSAWQRWIWLIDQQVTSINCELHNDLGDFIKILIGDLHSQWDLQWTAQLSLQAHVPTHLKKEVDIVLNLQGDLDAINTTLQSISTALSKSESSRDSIHLLTALQETHESLKAKVKTLYTSLKIHKSFPELQGLDLEFVQMLLMAHDLKINIQKWAIGSFFEQDKLDQAAGSHKEALALSKHSEGGFQMQASIDECNKEVQQIL
ncbi:hypothetical protein AN958_03669 [Leucoagaricus sp. SymC.cos]|nr:hypothetical protein AN958_03669 [Leucoagaricus sp. SymC.cos]